jgi:hypothetical protein
MNLPKGNQLSSQDAEAPYNGTRVVLADNLGQYTFSQSITNADILEANVIPSGVATLSGASTYVGNAAVQSAVYTVSVEVFQARLAGGGQIEGVDFTNSIPHGQIAFQ